jgi:ribosomal protein L37AE/L43A
MKTNKSDVSVEENVFECEVCTETLTGPSYRVMVDFRSAGFASAVVEVACVKCAVTAAARIRDGLPI